MLANTRPARLYVSRPSLDEYEDVLSRRELLIRKGLRLQLLQHIKEQYGSVSAYVEGLGAAPGLVDRLRSALLEPRA